MSGTEQKAAPAAGYERRDARIRPVVSAGALLLAVLVLGHCAARGLLAGFERGARAAAGRHPMAGERGEPIAPVLQSDPREHARRHAAREQEALETYGWIDSVGGVVRVPIERALELVLEEGLPARAGEEER